MNQNLTEIIFVLDRSGSMNHLASDTIGGFNTFIDTQKQAEGEAKLTTVLFDDKYEILHNGIDLKTVYPLTSKEYYARGMTALFDAVGKTINEVGARLANMPEEDRPGKVIFAITTDGHENASREFSRTQIKEMVTRQTDTYNWQFVFLGANIDAATEAENIGISSAFAATYSASAVGTISVYETLSKSIGDYRKTACLDSDWADDIK